MQLGNWLGLLLDEIFFAGYRRIKIEKPLFIAGIPRSGTTFTHRLLASDRAMFTTFTTWQAVFAPSIVQRRMVAGLARLDSVVGSPLAKGFGWLEARFTSSMDAIHGISLFEAEEDYLALLPVGGSFILVTLFPAAKELWRLGRLQELDADRRKDLLFFYKSCLQRHLHEAPKGSRLLSKNAAFASWLPEFREVFPDASYLLCIREPMSALSSQISALAPGLSFFATTGAQELVKKEMTAIFAAAYETLLTEYQRGPKSRYYIVDQARLKDDLEVMFTEALAWLGIGMSRDLAASLSSRAKRVKNYVSGHHHFDLRRELDGAGYEKATAVFYHGLKNASRV